MNFSRNRITVMELKTAHLIAIGKQSLDSTDGQSIRSDLMLLIGATNHLHTSSTFKLKLNNIILMKGKTAWHFKPIKLHVYLCPLEHKTAVVLSSVM